MPVFIEKTTGELANSVIFRVTPLTVQEAEDRHITNFTHPLNDISPSIASMIMNAS